MIDIIGETLQGDIYWSNGLTIFTNTSKDDMHALDDFGLPMGRRWYCDDSPIRRDLINRAFWETQVKF